MASLSRLCSASLQLNSRLFRPSTVRIVSISTSKKNKDTVTVTDVVTERTKTKSEEQTIASQNWISWGFNYSSQVTDNTVMHLTFFAAVTLCLVTTGFVWAYSPDFRMQDWAHREAFLQVRRREALGLPVIDANLIDPEKIELPLDEELGETEIII